MVAQVCNSSIWEWRQEDSEFKAILGYIGRLRLLFSRRDSVSEDNNEKDVEASVRKLKSEFL